jgi:hypothetical protein
MKTIQGPVSAPEQSLQLAVSKATATQQEAEETTQTAENGQAHIDKAEAQTDSGQVQQGPLEQQDHFFDPSKVPEELKPIYKAMQAAYTKKTQALAEQRKKIEAYDAFARDPVGTLEQLARQYGYTLTKSGPATGQGQGNPFADPNYQPQTWADLASDISNFVTQQLVSQLGQVIQPLYRSVEQITSKHIESQLDQIDPNWHLYEEEIKQNMQLFPQLIQTPDGLHKLYKISVPDEVYRGRIVKGVLEKYNEKAHAAKMATKSQSKMATATVRKITSFEDAVALAKEQLKKGG